MKVRCKPIRFFQSLLRANRGEKPGPPVAVHTKTFEIIFKARFKDAMKKAGLIHKINPAAWQRTFSTLFDSCLTIFGYASW